MRKFFAKFWREESGATALEYGMIAALVVVGLIASLNLFATRALGLYSLIMTTWQNAVH